MASEWSWHTTQRLLTCNRRLFDTWFDCHAPDTAELRTATAGCFKTTFVANWCSWRGWVIVDGAALAAMLWTVLFALRLTRPG